MLSTYLSDFHFRTVFYNNCYVTSGLQVSYGECSQQFLEECRGMGFTNNLMCSSCDELDKFNLHKLKDGCIGCCQQDSSNDAETEVGWITMM